MSGTLASNRVVPVETDLDSFEVLNGPLSEPHPQELPHGVSIRTATRVMAPQPPPPTHPTTGSMEMEDNLPPGIIRPPSKLTLKGEMHHFMISYRVSSEGPAGNNISGMLYKEAMRLSVDPGSEMRIPQHSVGIWPATAKQPAAYNKEMVKIFLDKECLFDGQSWEAGFINGLARSMVFVPLLSWTEDDRGSLGDMHNLAKNGNDRLDNVLLEFVVALECMKMEGSLLHAILPVMIGPPREDGSGFKNFLFSKLSTLSDKPSARTNQRAAEILRFLGASEHNIQKMLGRSVKANVELILMSQGVQAANSPSVEDFIGEAAKRVMGVILREIRSIRCDPAQFAFGRPMAHEVLLWLKQHGLRSYARAFSEEDLDSLQLVSTLSLEQVVVLVQEHADMFPLIGKGAVIGRVNELWTAVQRLTKDERAKSLTVRLHNFRDRTTSALSVVFAKHAIEAAFAKNSMRTVILLVGMSIGVCMGGVTYPEVDELGGATWPLFWGYICIASGLFFSTLASFVISPLTSWKIYCRFHLVAISFYAIWPLATMLELCSDSTKGAVSITPDNPNQQCDVPFALYSIRNSIVNVIFTTAFYMTAVYRQDYYFGVLFPVFIALFIISGTLTNLAECQASNYTAAWLCLQVFFSLGAAALMALLCILLIIRYLVLRTRAITKMKSEVVKYRPAWSEEVARSPPGSYETLQDRANGIARELKQQKKNKFAKLTVFDRWDVLLSGQYGRYSNYGMKVRQAHDNFELLFVQAAIVNEPFLDMMAELVADLGRQDGETARGRFLSGESIETGRNMPRGGGGRQQMGGGWELLRGPVKHPERAIEKVVRTYNRAANCLTDLVRCTIIAQGLHEVDDFLRMVELQSVVGLDNVWKEDDLSQRRKLFRITSLKNRFDSKYKDEESLGYRDLSLNLEVGWVMEQGLVLFCPVYEWETKYCDAMICEVQVRVRSLHNVTQKAGSHTEYVQWRNMVTK